MRLFQIMKTMPRFKIRETLIGLKIRIKKFKKSKMFKINYKSKNNLEKNDYCMHNTNYNCSNNFDNFFNYIFKKKP